MRAALAAEAPEQGEPTEALLRDFESVIVPGITHWNHPRFFGYYAISGTGPGILAELLTAVLNVNAMVWRSSPAATELEETTLDWLRRFIGLPPEFRVKVESAAPRSGDESCCKYGLGREAARATMPQPQPLLWPSAALRT